LINKEVDVDHTLLDAIVEDIAGEGCTRVNELLGALVKGEIPEQVAKCSLPERDYIYRELKSVMNVYETRECGD